MKRALITMLLLLLVLAGVMLARTLSLEPLERSTGPAPDLALDSRRMAKRLGRALQIPSIAEQEPSPLGRARIERMMDFLVEEYPPLMAQLEFERQDDGVVFRWRGTQPSLAPLLLLAHLDVVPVDAATEDDWIHPPFSGTIAGGAVWGRGALDDKSSALAMLEAIETLIGRGQRPRRSVIVALGLDEEIGGNRGAKSIAARFAEEGLEPYLVLDEGLAILEGIIPGVAASVAAVGIAEKGYMTLELSVAAKGGHASMPDAQTSIGILAAAIEALEASPFPARLDGAGETFLATLAPEMPFGPRLLAANTWIAAPLLAHELTKQPETAALLRTTLAATTFSGGVAANVLPERSSATINLRIHPRDTLAGVLERVSEVVDDPRIAIATLAEASEPTGLSPVDGEAFAFLAETIRAAYPGVVVAPSLVLGATDSRHYAALTPNIYRFYGIRLTSDDLARIHGVNERILITQYVELIGFYLRLIEDA